MMLLSGASFEKVMFLKLLKPKSFFHIYVKANERMAINKFQRSKFDLLTFPPRLLILASHQYIIKKPLAK